MMILTNLIGLLAVLLTMIAYYQTDRIRFLQVNVLAVSFFGMTLILNQGFTGGLISFVNVAVYIAAIFTSQKARQKLSCVMPLVAFSIAFYWYGTESVQRGDMPALLTANLPFIPAVATFLVTLSALQQSIVINKIILFSGVVLWALYSFLVGAWYALASDVVGLAVLLWSLHRIAGQRSKLAT
ncbi:hypothetical protein DXV75_01460 [Alteromonas aestuariivivens]|uniref:YgjV family protein n=1 Tax=Alteromonas aestuariivivens TaxID=1938339 RepID=A0A3D8MG11_9ALTE|nr:YgjV family protein [Alteromonas aestuariivivens]RDV29158.1 hypothetical protein DXV75_01460 [Alteromonas aestuariivivens]